VQRVDATPVAAGVVDLLMVGKRSDVFLEGDAVGIQLLVRTTWQPDIELAVPAIVGAALPNPAAVLIQDRQAV